MNVTVEAVGELVLIGLAGVLDISAENVLLQAYRAGADFRPKIIRLDFADVTFINSMGLALIVELLMQARHDAISLQASGLSDHARELFDITRLSDYVTLHERSVTNLNERDSF